MSQSEKELSLSKARKLVVEIAGYYGVECEIVDIGNTVGQCYYTWPLIYLTNRNVKPRYLINALFHELGHVYCYENNIWPKYHHGFADKCVTRNIARGVIMTGLRAERWIENWAAKEMQMWFPGMEYRFGYYMKSKVKKYNKNYLSWYRAKLK